MQSTKETQVKISPNLLKNFDVYNVLEPIKSGAKDSADLKVDKLIDIDDSSQDSGIHDCDLNASFVDQKREFNLVDLYQNIFVTPQHIKQKETAKIGSLNTNSKAFDIDLKQFLDKYECSQKVERPTHAEEVKSKPNFDVLIDKPRVLIPKVFVEPDSDPEDLINEILTQKHKEKRILDEMKRSTNKKPESSKKIENNDVVEDFSRLNLNKNVTKDSKLEIGNTVNGPRPCDLKPYSTNGQTNNSLSDFVVRSIQKDEKLYKKNHVVKPERLTSTYTKGPDFNEKFIVLPQIMARLNARSHYLAEMNNNKRRLILDTGSRPVKTETTTSNSKEQLKKNPNIQATKTNSVKHDVTKNKDPKLCMNSKTGSISVHSTANVCANCNKQGVKNPNTSGRGVCNPHEEYKDFGQVCPTVLMKDCNKERLKALKESQMVKNFVLYGKFDP